MDNSERFNELKRGLDELRRHLLPQDFDPTGKYEPDVITKTLAYRVLAHAEIEAYVEEKTWEAACSAINAFKERGTSSRILLTLLAYSGMQMELPPATIDPIQEKQRKDWANKTKLMKKLEKAVNSFRRSIDLNHGIKEENILKLLLPVGIKDVEIDELWLANINSFAEMRGLAAHSSSSSSRAKQQVDPRTELERVESIIEGLSAIDISLEDKIKSSCS